MEGEEEKPRCPKTWLAESIVATILCCLPFGVVGIVYAARVSSLYSEGRYDEAESSSRNAKTWTIVSAIVGIVCFIVSFGLGLLGFIFGNA